MATLFLQDKTKRHEGLARESQLLDADVALPLLYLWRGPRAIVMGKNQNPWKECNLTWMREQALPLARRISGGGTVYHDPGNLNISFIVDRNQYDGNALLAGIVNALNALGFPAESSGTGNVLVNGKKVSGSAFCYRKKRVLHHCTLLIDADLDALRSALSPPHTRIDTHAVDSIPAAVTNLNMEQPGIAFQDIQQQLVHTFSRHWGEEMKRQDLPSLQESPMADFSKPDWIWGQTPRFSFELPSLPLSITVRKGHVMEASDPRLIGLAFAPGFPAQLSDFYGCPLEKIEQLLAEEGLTFH